jgi:hypothetical protein
MKVEIEFKDEDVKDALVTAIESGTSYWREFKGTKKLVPNKYEDKARSENLIAFVLEDGGEITVIDAEDDDDEVLGVFNKANVLRGLKLFVESGHKFDAAMDAEDADVLFQLMIMGEVIYG